MKVKEIKEIIDGKIACGEEYLNYDISHAFASDLMSDVLTINSEKLALITGLTNLQTIRTSEMSDIYFIIFARNKKVTEEMIKLAKSNRMVLLECPYSLYKTSGLLYLAGLKPIY